MSPREEKGRRLWPLFSGCLSLFAFPLVLPSPLPRRPRPPRTEWELRSLARAVAACPPSVVHPFEMCLQGREYGLCAWQSARRWQERGPAGERQEVFCSLGSRACGQLMCCCPCRGERGRSHYSSSCCNRCHAVCEIGWEAGTYYLIFLEHIEDGEVEQGRVASLRTARVSQGKRGTYRLIAIRKTCHGP